MSVYASVLVLAQLQAEAADRGDLDAAARLFDDRAVLLAEAPAPGATDADAIRQILLLDRQLSTRIRERMITIRNESSTLRRITNIVAAYTPESGFRPRLLEALG